MNAKEKHEFKNMINYIINLDLERNLYITILTRRLKASLCRTVC